YVGKAKSLKSRVTSYFNQQKNISRKTRRLVSQINSIQYTIVDSEFDALLLENALIKENQPKYNINLKDDKSYPHICIVNERFPRIISTRRRFEGSGEYFGPFTNVKAVYALLELIRKLYKIRTCRLALSEENIRKEKFSVCLEYHIGNCKGPCVNKQTEADYNQEIAQARHILKGNIGVVKTYFKDKIAKHAKKLEFEKAQEAKEKLDSLERYQSKSIVANIKADNLHVFGIASEGNKAVVHSISIVNGNIVSSQNTIIKKSLEETEEELLTSSIAHMLSEELSSQSKVPIISHLPLAVLLPETVSFSVPEIGDKKKLVLLAIKNARQKLMELTLSNQQQKDRTPEVLTIMKDDLRLTELPKHIECFDNSNIQGTNPVASMVCFKNGRPSKKDYRHFNIKTVVGPDDFASMREVVYRRYRRLLDEEQDLPQLIIVDGGKGQLSSACESLKTLDLYGKIAIVGIAKRLEEIYYPEDSLPLYINKKSPSLKVIQQLRNEAHRFAITFHRLKRSNNFISTELTDIPGIGPSTYEQLLKRFKSLKKIRETSLKELANEIGNVKATSIRDYFDKTS
ncbi:MAG: excinuclease ABC subunit UvrC, partial [Cyclobacteriaceae bacterium]